MVSSEVAYPWDPISDLPENWNDLRRDDLHLVQKQWTEEKSILKDPEKIQKLEDKLSTEWAIETGIIERLYVLDRGITETLIELGLEALHQLHERGTVSQDAVRLIEDQRETLEFVFQFVKQDRELSLSYIKELHQLLTRHQETCNAVDQFGNEAQVPLLKGEWKKLPNNPTLPDGRVHEYCPPEFVQDEMEQLVKLHQTHEESGALKASGAIEVKAAWLHHRFAQIHPFQDGNGRVARALATIVFLRADYLPLVIRDTEHRERYIESLRDADQGDLVGLINLFADIEIADQTKAIKTVRELRGEGVAKIAASAAERVKARQLQTEEEERELTESLVQVATVRLEEVKQELELSFHRQGAQIHASVFESGPATAEYWTYQVVETAKHHGHYADLGRFRAWVQLRLRLPRIAPQTSIVISFHHRDYVRGLMVATAFVTTSVHDDAEKGTTEGPSWGQLECEVVPSDLFSYSTSHADPEPAFRRWLDQIIETALDMWQARI